MNLLLVDEHEISPQNTVILRDERARHVREVLKLGVGDELRAGVVNGKMGLSRVTETNAQSITIEIGDVLERGVLPPKPRVDLLLAAPRPKVLKRLYSELACIGVGHIFLTAAARVEKSYLHNTIVNEAEWNARFREGLSQARDTHLPTVSEHPSLTWLIEKQLLRHHPYAHRLIADVPLFAGEKSFCVAERLKNIAPHERVVVAVGPEGGWQDQERELFRAHGFHVVQAGSRALRSDIACIAILTLIHEAVGDC